MLSITEIVSSLHGEGKYTGFPCTFIRLHGCPNRCRYCDSLHAVTQKRKKRMSIETVCNYVFRMRNSYVCITGGEPLIQDDCLPLVYELLSRGYKVNVETSGTVEIEESYHRSFHYTMDIKCPSSGISHKNIYSNLDNLQSIDEVKFVISDLEDYCFAKDVLKQYSTKASIIFSSCFHPNGENIAKELSNWLIEDKLHNVRLGVQVHKLVGFY